MTQAVYPNELWPKKMTQELFLQGMHGLGDSIFQRAIVRHYMRDFSVYLDNTWPCIYHDLVAKGLKLVRREMSPKLRTQAKNYARESHLYVKQPQDLPGKRVWWTHEGVRKSGFLGAMCEFTGCPVATADYRLPIAPAWRDATDRLIASWGAKKPILLYRPLVERTEWAGCVARNPDHRAYSELFNSIRDRFFVVSLADLEPDKEWIVGNPIKVDIEYHKGELQIPVLAALTARAAMVFASPGFMLILAQAVGTPSVVTFGGHESSRLYRAAAKYAPFLYIDPIEPCECFSKAHVCKKAIDLPKAKRQLREFTDAVTESKNYAGRDRLGRSHAPIYESGRA